MFNVSKNIRGFALEGALVDTNAALVCTINNSITCLRLSDVP